MYTIGIAGGSGTGKSTIAGHIASRYQGVHIDADQVAHQVLEEAAVIGEIRREFGAGVIDADGLVNRRRLGVYVFSDAGRRAALNAIVHPAIVARCASRVESARENGAGVAVVDAALLLEVDMMIAFDFTIALTCDPEIRLARLRGRGGWSEGELRSRLDAQSGLEKHFYKADAVVDTGPSLPEVLAAIDRLLDERMSRRQE
ncbi:MAG TPA: dephospho-CoA kinase [Candidatus Krumholzibacteria bacterium]|nr:dephospho-CoA kinase [Candidatus Krumholzibacteria bacterium]